MRGIDIQFVRICSDLSEAVRSLQAADIHAKSTLAALSKDFDQKIDEIRSTVKGSRDKAIVDNATSNIQALQKEKAEVCRQHLSTHEATTKQTRTTVQALREEYSRLQRVIDAFEAKVRECKLESMDEQDIYLLLKFFGASVDYEDNILAHHVTGKQLQVFTTRDFVSFLRIPQIGIQRKIERCIAKMNANIAPQIPSLVRIARQQLADNSSSTDGQECTRSPLTEEFIAHWTISDVESCFSHKELGADVIQILKNHYVDGEVLFDLSLMDLELMGIEDDSRQTIMNCIDELKATNMQYYIKYHSNVFITSAPGYEKKLESLPEVPESNIEVTYDERVEPLDIPDVFDDTNAPFDLLCPISCCIMKEPVTALDGHTYDRCSIEAWFRSGHNSSPLTRATIPPILMPNHQARDNIIKFVQSQSK